jgi:hypothetical protein
VTVAAKILILPLRLILLFFKKLKRNIRPCGEDRSATSTRTYLHRHWVGDFDTRAY